MGLVRTRIDRDRALEQLLRLFQAPALLHRQAEQVRGVEMIRNGLHDLAAERLGLRIPALAIGACRGRDDGVRLLFQFLLQSRILECARAGAALQGVSPEDGPRRV
ncbi:hypothetical protein QNN01_24385 [Bradyrhizobium diazoefficiens]|nr:hypothetical protein [Bradyrhizobium diazoefficiens]WLA69687.1 hypothetical protein QNN01_24385 [Bradyrhizobium diazoefficiens]